MTNPNWFQSPPDMMTGDLPPDPSDVVLPRVDVLETDTEFIYIFEVPGPDPNQIDVEISEREITLTGPENTPAPPGTRRYHHLERPQGRYMRLLRTPSGVDTDAAAATYRHGQLELHLPKKTGAGH